MSAVDYKSHELNLYSNNNVGRLKFEDGKGTNKAPGFGQNQEYIFAKYTDSASGAMQWPLVIPSLHTIDDSTGTVMGVSYWIGDAKQKLLDESKERKAEDAKLQSNIATESATRLAQISSLSSMIAVEINDRKNGDSAEAKLREDGDAKLASDLAAETAARQQADNGNWATILIVEADSKARDLALDAKIVGEINVEAQARIEGDNAAIARHNDLTVFVNNVNVDSMNRDYALDTKLGIETTRASDAEVTLQLSLEAEAKIRGDDVKRLDDRIDFIQSNVDPVAIDSLTEIVSQFSQNGQTYASRLTYLEGVVASLVNKSQ